MSRPAQFRMVGPRTVLLRYDSAEAATTFTHRFTYPPGGGGITHEDGRPVGPLLGVTGPQLTANDDAGLMEAIRRAFRARMKADPARQPVRRCLRG